MAYPTRAPVPVSVPSAPLPDRPWSASAIEDFLGCPLRYWWRKVQGWQTPSTVPMVTGRAVHLALEHLLALPPTERLPDRAEEFLAEAIASELAEAGPRIAEAEVTAGAEAAMAAYWQTESPSSIEVAPDGLERTVEVPLRGLPFLGYIDRVAVVDTGLRVTDYKTGAPKPRYWWGYWRQQMLYAAALAALDQPVAEVELLYLKQPRAVTRPVYPAAVGRALAELETAQEQRATMADANTWEARPGPLCRYCDFASACPSQRGRVPEPGTPASDELLIEAGLTRRHHEPTAGDLLDMLDDEGRT